MGSDWKSKLYVKVQAEGINAVLTPIVDITPTFNTPHTPEHSLEADNVGVTKTNDTFTFNLTVKALRDIVTGTNPAKLMTQLQLKHLPFDIIMIERKTSASNGKNWAFEQSLQLKDCYVNSGSPTRAVVNTSPVATFSCMCLGVNIDTEFYNGTLPST